MLYSSAGILALIIHLIINHDVMWYRKGKHTFPSRSAYRAFLYAVMVYYIADILWGVLYENHLMTLTFIDTALYFFAMASSILLWTRFVVGYLQETNFFGKLLRYAGWIFFAFEMLVVVMNFIVPVLFSFDSQGNYHAESGRYITLGIQFLMFLFSAIYALVIAFKKKGIIKSRYRTIGLSSLAMTGFVISQVLFPLLPLYAIGCMLATCVLHSFVLENEKEQYTGELEEKLRDNIEKGNYYDLLTGLPGMTYFFDLADQNRKRIIAEGGTPALLFLDLSGMKIYNLKYGFSAGDRLLQEFVAILTRIFKDENCSRLGSDHFLALAESNGLEDKINELFREWDQKKDEDTPAIRIGIYLDEGRHVDISVACDMAKSARDTIRKSYISAYRYFSEDMMEDAANRQYIASRLDKAIEEGWIQVYFQPIVRAANGRVCEEEALARWIDPERGMLSPAEFIPILEDASLIYKLDLNIVDQVLNKMHKTREEGLFLVPQSVNLSRSDFDSCDMVEEVIKRVDAAGFEHRMLSIEITESIVGSDFEYIRKQIQRFRAAGFPVWMDDFGSGYSSLDVLADAPVDLIKLDMRFMQNFDSDNKTKVILTELMKMATGLGIDTICEGVEREDQVEFLKNIGCSKMQGYYYTKPLSMEQVFERYRKGIQIGFENPDETEYYDAIGRINLYDLSVVAKEEDGLQHYFSTIPMALVELQDDKIRFTRTNPAYRDFVEREFNADSSNLETAFAQIPKENESSFYKNIMDCCKEGIRTMFDEKMPDGSVVHSFMRRIAVNPITGTIAAVVVVLAITNLPESNS